MIDQALWIGTSAVVVGLVVRAINTDGMAEVLSSFAGKMVNVPPRILPWLALLFGLASAVLNAKVNGATWQVALAGGIVSSATAAFGHSLGKTVPVVRAVVMGRSSRLPVVFFLVCTALAGGSQLGCPSSPTSPTVDADAAGAVVNDVCDLIQGIDSNGAVRSVCATVEEVITIIAPYVVSLLDASDAGPSPSDPCTPLPHSAVCATSSQRAKGILYLTRVKQARLMLDAGFVK